MPQEEESPSESITYPVWQDNIDTLNVFLACANKWDLLIFPSGQVIRQSINDTKLEIVMKRLRVKDKDQTWAEIQAMEAAALEQLRQE